MVLRDVFLFAKITCHVIQLWLGAIEFAEEFPFAITHSEIGEIGVSVVLITIGRAPEEDRGLSGRITFAKQHVRE